MVVDYILMNEDRHLSNIEFIIGPSTVRFSPFFDFGKSFLCRDGIMSKSQFVTLERKFKTKPFSSNPEKNLIDIQYAKVICTKIINNIGDINNLGIPEFHKFVIKQRISRLMNL
jgi:serine/threonine protein kinase HipA of HipAB toxin-antitoxin module